MHHLRLIPIPQSSEPKSTRESSLGKRAYRKIGFQCEERRHSGAVGLACLGVSSSAWAGIGDYEFQLVQNQIKKGGDAILAVRLIDKRSGKPAPDAVVIAKRVDMAPDAGSHHGGSGDLPSARNEFAAVGLGMGLASSIVAGPRWDAVVAIRGGGFRLHRLRLCSLSQLGLAPISSARVSRRRATEAF
jgi:YtkA-like